MKIAELGSHLWEEKNNVKIAKSIIQHMSNWHMSTNRGSILNKQLSTFSFNNIRMYKGIDGYILHYTNPICIVLIKIENIKSHNWHNLARHIHLFILLELVYPFISLNFFSHISIVRMLYLLKSIRNRPNPWRWYWGIVIIQLTLYFWTQCFSLEKYPTKWHPFLSFFVNT